MIEKNNFQRKSKKPFITFIEKKVVHIEREIFETGGSLKLTSTLH